MTRDDRSEARAPIAVLPPYLADQIAAGEVVERPASALKELIDNAIDAGATRVEVLLEAGGTQRIRVIDDGIGIRPEELGLALRRHATSKLRSADELLDVASLGFRGEALASIASVARVSLRSRVVGAATGFELISDPLDAVEGSAATLPEGRAHAAAPRPVGMPLGTQLDITDLFAAVPARRKFLRSVATETAHCVEVVLRIALVHPDVELSLQHDGRALLHFPRQDLDARVRMILERRGVERVHGFVAELNGVSLRAWLGDVSSAQSNGALSVIVRRRVVVERSLTKILYTALGPSVDAEPQTRRCGGVLMLEPGAGSVDVNVHPQKLEVRFSDPQRIYSALRQAAAQWRSERDARLEVSLPNPNATASGQLRGDLPRDGSGSMATGEGAARRPHLVELAGHHAPAGDARPRRDGQDSGERSDRSDRGYALRTRAAQPDYDQQRQSVRAQVEALAALSRRDDDLHAQGRLQGLHDDPTGMSRASARDDAREPSARLGSQLDIDVPIQRDRSELSRAGEVAGLASSWGATEPAEAQGTRVSAMNSGDLASVSRHGERPADVDAVHREASSDAHPGTQGAVDPVIIGALPGGVVLLLHDNALYAMELARVRDELAFRRLAEEITGEQGIAIQRLLHPIVLHKSPSEIELLARSSELLHPLGLDLEPFGEGCVALRGVPASLGWLSELDHVGTLVDRALAWLRLRESSRDPLTLLGAFARAPTAADQRYAKRWLKDVVVRLRRDANLNDQGDRIDLGSFPGLHRWQAHELIGAVGGPRNPGGRDEAALDSHSDRERREGKTVAEPSR